MAMLIDLGPSRWSRLGEALGTGIGGGFSRAIQQRLAQAIEEEQRRKAIERQYSDIKSLADAFGDTIPQGLQAILGRAPQSELGISLMQSALQQALQQKEEHPDYVIGTAFNDAYGRRVTPVYDKRTGELVRTIPVGRVPVDGGDRGESFKSTTYIDEEGYKVMAFVDPKTGKKKAVRVGKAFVNDPLLPYVVSALSMNFDFMSAPPEKQAEMIANAMKAFRGAFTFSAGEQDQENIRDIALKEAAELVRGGMSPEEAAAFVNKKYGLTQNTGRGHFIRKPIPKPIPIRR